MKLLLATVLILSSTLPAMAQRTTEQMDRQPTSFIDTPNTLTVMGHWHGASLVHNNRTEVDCIRVKRICIEATAWDDSSTGVRVDLVVYDIASWDADGIVATNSSSICITNKLQVTFADKNVTAMALPKNSHTGVCEQFHTESFTIQFGLGK